MAERTSILEDGAALERDAVAAGADHAASADAHAPAWSSAARGFCVKSTS